MDSSLILTGTTTDLSGTATSLFQIRDDDTSFLIVILLAIIAITLILDFIRRMFNSHIRS